MLEIPKTINYYTLTSGETVNDTLSGSQHVSSTSVLTEWPVPINMHPVAFMHTGYEMSYLLLVKTAIHKNVGLDV